MTYNVFGGTLNPTLLLLLNLTVRELLPTDVQARQWYDDSLPVTEHAVVERGRSQLQVST